MTTVKHGCAGPDAGFELPCLAWIIWYGTTANPEIAGREPSPAPSTRASSRARGHRHTARGKPSGRTDDGERSSATTVGLSGSPARDITAEGDDWTLHPGDSAERVGWLVGLSVFSPPFPEPMYVYSHPTASRIAGTVAANVARARPYRRIHLKPSTQSWSPRTRSRVGIDDSRQRHQNERAGWIYYGEVCIYDEPARTIAPRTCYSTRKPPNSSTRKAANSPAAAAKQASTVASAHGQIYGTGGDRDRRQHGRRVPRPDRGEARARPNETARH